MRVACVQLNSRSDKAVNVAAAVELVRRAADAPAQLRAVAPELLNHPRYIHQRDLLPR